MENHNEVFNELQEEYYKKNRDKTTLGKMYKVAFKICFNYINLYAKNKKLKGFDIEEKADIAALYIIDRYFKNKDFKIQKLSAYAHFGCMKALFNDYEKEQNEVNVDFISYM